jgi:hypothetical protein
MSLYLMRRTSIGAQFKSDIISVTELVLWYLLLNQSLGFIKRNLKVHSPAIKEHAFKALVRLKLEYCNTIWDPHTQQQKFQIEKIQRRAAHYVNNRYHNTSSVTYKWIWMVMSKYFAESIFSSVCPEIVFRFCTFVWVEVHEPVLFPFTCSIKILLEFYCIFFVFYLFVFLLKFQSINWYQQIYF